MIKKITIALVAILSSTSAFAGHGDDLPLPPPGVNLMAPHQEGSWSFGLQANYFEPNNDFNYAFGQQATTAGISSLNQTKTYAVNSNYQWGWGADVTYHFPGEGRDVTLAFTQLNSSDSDSVDLEGNQLTSLRGAGLPALYEIFGNATLTNASGKVRTNYDAVDLTFGQLITAGNRITLHPFAGLRYAYVDYKATGNYSIFTNDGRGGGDEVTLVATQTLKSTFNGAGPRLGSDAAVNLGSGFSLRGTLGVSLLVGSMDSDADYSRAAYASNVLTNMTDTDHSTDTNTRVVPEADAKLSAMYHADFNNGYGLGFEVGYQVTNYFDAIQNSAISTLDNSTEYTDFFLQGPYARIQLDVA